jgi:kynurenine formamidase
MTPVRLPLYAELPELNGLGLKHSRGLLPVQRGTLAFISPDAVATAAAEVADGLPVSLSLPVDAFDPPLFSRVPLAHRVIEASRNEAEDILDSFNPQASSQLDGLAHVRARESGYYDGSTDLAAACVAIGMQHWASTGIAARGVLLDAVAGFDLDPFAGAAITPAMLSELATRQQVELRPGDVLLIRTGWGARYLALGAGERSKTAHWSGLHAGEATAEFLWDNRIALVGSDNPAVENAPGDRAIGSLHRRLLPALGMSLLELLDLERLAAECARRGRWSFLFISVPLYVRGAVSSPANAIALL